MYIEDPKLADIKIIYNDTKQERILKNVTVDLAGWCFESNDESNF